MTMDLSYPASNDLIELIEELKELESKKKKYEISEVESYYRDLKYRDILFMQVFYGLFLSLELPPLDKDRIIIDKTNREIRINAQQAENIRILRHYMLVLWLSQNKMSEIGKIDYKISLYKFIKKILKINYIVKVVVPFYLKKASERIEGEPSFSILMKDGYKYSYINSIYTPEFIVAQILRVKKKFNKSLEKKLDMSEAEI